MHSLLDDACGLQGLQYVSGELMGSYCGVIRVGEDIIQLEFSAFATGPCTSKHL